VQAAMVAKSQGALPADVERLVGELTQAKVKWTDELMEFVSTVARDAYDWNRPNKRFIQQGIYMPRLHSQKCGPIMVVIDTSGSIGSKELDQFRSELGNIISQLRPEKVHCIDCDADIQRHLELEPGDELPKDCKGGGGTSFVPVEELIESMDEKPLCVVYLTDAWSSWNKEPDVPVLTVSTTDRTAPYGRTIKLELN